VPPVTVAVATALQSPLHNRVDEFTVTASVVGCISVMVDVLIHPVESVIVRVYVPGQSPVISGVPCPTKGHPAGPDQTYVYPGFPPAASACAVPLLLPLQVGSVLVRAKVN
jgi:hypothetical protein